MPNWEKFLRKLAKEKGWDASNLIDFVGDYYYALAREDPGDMAADHLDLLAEHEPDILKAEAVEIYEASMADEGD